METLTCLSFNLPGGGFLVSLSTKLKYFTFNFEPYCICKIFGFCKRILLLVHLKYPVIIEYQRLMMKCHVFAYNNIIKYQNVNQTRTGST